MAKKNKRWLLFFSSLLFSLFMAELAVRIVGEEPPPPIKIFDEQTGFRLRPKMEGIWRVENEAYFKFNSFGFRDHEWEVEKSRFRVAILGDSFTEALQVPLEDTFHKIVEAELGNVEIMSFGISGQGTVEQLLTYRHYVRNFDPDLIVLAFFPGNDPIENVRRTKRSVRFPVKVEQTEAGDLSLRKMTIPVFLNPVWKLIDIANNHSLLVQKCFELRRSLFAKYYRKGALTEAGLWPGAFGLQVQGNEQVDATWKLTERIILLLRDEVETDLNKRNALLVMCLTQAAQVHDPKRRQFQRDYPHLDIDYAEKRLSLFCEENQIPFLALSEELLKYNRNTGRTIHGFAKQEHGHYNYDGHKIVAQLLARKIKELRSNL